MEPALPQLNASQAMEPKHTAADQSKSASGKENEPQQDKPQKKYISNESRGCMRL